MSYDFHRITLFWNGYGPSKSGRRRNYLHFHQRLPDEAVELVYTAWANLSDAQLGEVRRHQSYSFDFDGDPPETTIFQNAGIFVFEMEDDTYESIAIPAIDTSLYTNNILTEPYPPQVETFVQEILNNWTPKPGVDCTAFVGGYFGILRILNQTW